MPGLSFICDLKSDLKEKESIILESLDSMIHFNQYKKKILLSEKSYFLGATTYDEYPITSFENDEYLIYLEGKLYGKDFSLTNMHLNRLAEHIFQSHIKSEEQIAEWLLTTDGDFIIFILNKKTKEIGIINDALGLLPLYYYKTEKKLLVSRELRFIRNLISSIKFDRMAIAQYLLFCHTLGKRTLLENVYRLEAGTLVKINFINFKIEICNVHRFNFEKKKYSERTIEENASGLVAKFNNACKNRANSFNGYENVLSLSGGLDSRAVGACLQKNNIRFCGATFLDFEKKSAIDAGIAEQLAKTFKIEWKLFKLAPPKGSDYLKLLRIKYGMNYLAMSYILPFFEKIKVAYGSRIIYYTGDLGLPTMRNNCPSKKLKNLDELVDYILHKNTSFALYDVANIVGLDKDEIIEELKELLLSYPENSLSQKHVHFKIFERAFNWGLEGVDRNRYYFWSATPLLSTQVFHYSMNCPDEQKAPHKIYKRFLLKLSPRAASITNADDNLPITSKRFLIKNFILSAYSNKFPLGFKKLVKKYLLKNVSSFENNSNFVNCLREQLSNCRTIPEYLSPLVIKKIIKDISKNQFEILFTITSSIEEIECNRSTIEKYKNDDFI